jgi:hypothetical protein
MPEKKPHKHGQKQQKSEPGVEEFFVNGSG